MKWCCIGFQGRYGVAGQGGIGLLVTRNIVNGPSFILQSRVVDHGLEGSVKAVDESTRLILVSEVEILNCPWCGCRLAAWYFADIDALRRLDLELPMPLAEIRTPHKTGE